MSINFFTELIRDRYKDKNGIPFRSDNARIIARLIMRANNAKTERTMESDILEDISNSNSIKNILSRRESEYNQYILYNTDEYLNIEYAA